MKFLQIVAAFVASIAVVVYGETVYVNNAADYANQNCADFNGCTLRAAVSQCQQSVESCIVVLPQTSTIFFDLSLGPIVLANPAHDITIDGQGCVVIPWYAGEGQFLLVEGVASLLHIFNLEIRGFQSPDYVIKFSNTQGYTYLTNVDMVNNSATSEGIFTIAESMNGQFFFGDCYFHGNMNSAALVASTAGQITVTNCQFGNNNGGGMQIHTANQVDVTDSYFYNNGNVYGGGIMIAGPVSGEVHILRSNFDFNTASYGGGAIAFAGVTGGAFVTDCVFGGNICEIGSGGAIAYLDSGTCDGFGRSLLPRAGIPRVRGILDVPDKPTHVDRGSRPVDEGHRSLDTTEFQCAPYSASNYEAVPCYVTVCGGDRVEASHCSAGSSCSGDTYLALYSESGTSVVEVDDFCNLCSHIDYYVSPERFEFINPSNQCEIWTVWQKCYADDSCSGITAMKLTHNYVPTDDYYPPSGDDYGSVGYDDDYYTPSYDMFGAVTGCTFHSNEAMPSGMSYREGSSDSTTGPGHGGAVSLGCGGRYSLSANTFIGNTALRGGAVAVPSTVTGVNVTSCDFTDNEASDEGGGLYLGAFISQAYVENITFVDNRAGGMGGGMFVWLACDGLQIKGSTFRGNQAYGGGGLNLFNLNDGAIVDGCTFDQNLASALYGDCYDKYYSMNESGTMTTKYESFCYPPGGALAAYYYNSAVSIRNCMITDNMGEYGGGVLGLYGNTELSVVGSTFRGNIGLGGGGFHLESHNLGSWLSGCTFEKNHADGLDYGGGAVLSYFANHQFSVQKCVFVNNTSAGYAAALHVINDIRDVYITDCEFSLNTAQGYAAVVVFSEGNSNAVISNCSFTSNRGLGVGMVSWGLSGGVIDVYRDHGGLYVTNCTFTDNDSQDDAGVLHISDDHNKLVVRDCSFSGNRGLRTGAIYATNTATIEIGRCLFEDNVATGIGAADKAGVMMSERSDVYMNQCTLKNNRGQSSGGVFHQWGVLDVQTCTFEDNVALGAESNGGALIYYDDESTGSLAVRSSVFKRNTAVLAGGAMFVLGEFRITNSLFERNSVSSTDGIGGAAYLQDFRGGNSSTTPSHISGNSFRGNVACDVGALYLLNETFRLESLNNFFIGNIASCGVNDDMYHSGVSSTLSSCDCSGTRSFTSYAVANVAHLDDILVLAVSLGK